MSVTSTDIVIYAAQNMPVDDTSTAGGAVNSGIRVVFEDIVATDTVSVSGSSASDTGNITITGRSAAGAVVTDTFAMSGTSLVAGTQSFERILIAQTAAAAVGTVRVQDTSTSTAIGTIAVAESGFRRPFYDATANAAGGAAKTLYEKCFIANNHATLALLGATVIEVSSGVYADMTFGLEANVSSSQSVTDRTTVPTGVGSYGNGASGVPQTNLDPVTQHGMWLKFELAAGAAAQNSFYQFQVSGTTT
jgi:hypothetical protein